MGQMPQWFAKTRDMVRSDLFFSLKHAGGVEQLVERYTQALDRLDAQPEYFRHSEVLQGGTSHHFDTDWIYKDYPSDPNKGGNYWPTIPSSKVVSLIRNGTRLAIHKALGGRLRPTLNELHIIHVGSLDVDEYIDQLFVTERDYGVDLEEVLSLATSWNCVAPPGSDFFEVDAIRGPSVVEFAIATPRPLGMGLMMPLIEEMDATSGKSTRNDA